MSAAKSDHHHNYKLYFEILRENQEFERQHFLMSRPHLDFTPIGTSTANTKMSHLESTYVGIKATYPNPLSQPIESSKWNEKYHV